MTAPIVYCSARQGIATLDMTNPGENLIPLFEKIVRHIPAPSGSADGPVQMLVSALDYSDYVGSIGIGRIERGTLKQNQQVVLVNYHKPDQSIKAKVTNIYQFEGLARVTAESATVGDIVCVSGVEGVSIGDTICDPAVPEALEFPKISEPSVEMTFSVNDSPFAGRGG